jgi:LmbE family N-acetylglucosaminyl deacetylase
MILLDSIRGQRILLVVAHPDDELLGCGASLNKLIDEYNCHVKVVILGEGITSRSDKRDIQKWQKQLETHKENIRKAQKAIGYQELSTYEFPDNRFDSVDLLDIVKSIETEKTAFNPSVLMTHHGGDLNIDHQRTFEAVVTACRPMSHEMVKSIITFETPSGTEWQAGSDPRHFIPNLFFRVSKKNLEAKIAGIEFYEFERRPYPHPRSAEALRIQAQRWGVAIGVDFAEAFMIIRTVN